MTRYLALALLPLVAACAATPQATTNAPVRSTAGAVRVPPSEGTRPPASGFRTARVMNMPGLEGVIGADVDGLQRQFGTARLDVFEGDVRKLQFSGEACVLDVYLYPPAPGAKPTATYVDARRSSDGLDVDRAACVKALQR